VALVLLRLTDIFDGRAARELGVVSDRGSKMDPLADGVLGFGLAAVAVVTVPGKTSAAVGFALAGYFVIRLVLDTAVMVQRVEESNRAVVPLPTKWGKLKYNLDYALLFLIHAGVLAHAGAGWPLTAALLLSAAVAPLNLWFGMKNLQAHRARITPPVPVTMEPHRSR
jgi:phosphatidylglycerophosphate synthase